VGKTAPPSLFSSALVSPWFGKYLFLLICWQGGLKKNVSRHCFIRNMAQVWPFLLNKNDIKPRVLRGVSFYGILTQRVMRNDPTNNEIEMTFGLFITHWSEATVFGYGNNPLFTKLYAE